MKRLLFATLLAVTSVFTANAEVSITIGQPGFYGRIDIGGYPQPRLIFPQPIIIAPVAVHQAPVYLRVPPGHAKDWHKHCHHYNACGEPVYFVQDDWYEREYAPRYQEHHGHHVDEGKHEYHRDNYREYNHKPRHAKKYKGNHKHKPYKYNQHGHSKGNNGNKHGNHGRGHNR